MGLGTQPTQPPHPQPVLDIARDDVTVSGCVDISGFATATTDSAAVGTDPVPIRVPSIVYDATFSPVSYHGTL